MIKLIRDRGHIKWASMMLPEHVKLLREYHRNLNKLEKPILDEHKHEEFNEIISQALTENTRLEFTYYQEGEMIKYIGNINQMDDLTKEIQITDSSGNHHRLSVNRIVEIE